MSIIKQLTVRIKFEGKNLANLDFWTKSDPFLVVSRPTRNGSGFTRVIKTETVRNNLAPSWKEVSVSTSELCNDDYDMPLHIEVYDEDRNSRNDLIGSVHLCLEELHCLAWSGTPVMLKKREKERGLLLITKCQIEGREPRKIPLQVQAAEMLGLEIPNHRNSSAIINYENMGKEIYLEDTIKEINLGIDSTEIAFKNASLENEIKSTSLDTTLEETILENSSKETSLDITCNEITSKNNSYKDTDLENNVKEMNLDLNNTKTIVDETTFRINKITWIRVNTGMGYGYWVAKSKL